MSEDEYEQRIKRRLNNEKISGFLEARTLLTHFALITYLVPEEKLLRFVPEKFELIKVEHEGRPHGILNVACYISEKFRFKNILPFIRMDYGQTNYRIFVKDHTGDPSALFIDNSVGTMIYKIPKFLWKLPWYRVKYDFQCTEDHYYLETKVRNELDSIVSLSATNQEVEVPDCFSSRSEMMYIMTHNYKGYYNRGNSVGAYKVWHSKFSINTAKVQELYFRRLEELNLLGKEEMETPFTCWLAEDIEYRIKFPPKKISMIS